MSQKPKTREPRPHRKSRGDTTVASYTSKRREGSMVVSHVQGLKHKRAKAVATVSPIPQRRPKSTATERSTVVAAVKLLGQPEILKLLQVLEEEGDATSTQLTVGTNLSKARVEQRLRELERQGIVSHRNRRGQVYHHLKDRGLVPSLRALAEASRAAFLPDEPATEVAKASEEKFPAEIGRPLEALYHPQSGRLDASRIAEYFDIPLKQIAAALRRGYSTVHKTPDAQALQASLQPMARSIEVVEEMLGSRAAALAWWNRPHDDLGERTPLEVLLEGYVGAVQSMLEGALMGIPA